MGTLNAVQYLHGECKTLSATKIVEKIPLLITTRSKKDGADNKVVNKIK